MCGIVGIVSLPGASPVNAEWIKAMTDAMSHRGPDGEGLWLSDDQTVGMGHRRLSIVDLSELGAQPMIDEQSGIALTYNGEIYNFKDLKASLESKGCSFRSQTDTEVLLQQLVQFWDKGLEAISGDYAFGAWNPLSKSLLLVRDRAGMKPLFYAKTPSKHLVFASELRALLSSGLIPFEIDDEALFHYLTYLVSPPGRSLVKGVHKLGIGEAAEINATNGAIRCWRYWEPLPGQANSSDNETLFEEFRHLFQDSVRDRLMSDVPVGTLFSGGVDSILNTGVFQIETAPSPVRSFTVGMPGQRTDESAWARQMASQLGTVPHEVMIDTDRVVEDLEQLCWIQDEPVADPVSIPLYYVTKLARDKGTIVLQGGEGADELFCGYSGYMKYLSKKAQIWDRIAPLPSPVLKLGASIMSAAQRLHSEAGCYGDILGRAGRGEAFFLSNAVAFYDSEKGSVLTNEFRERCRGLSAYDVVKPFYSRLDEAVPEASFLQRLTFIELNLRLPELLLMRLDKIAMANSIEVRAPFLDHRLIEFAISAPQSFKLKDGVAKEPVKRYGAEFVGRDKVYRPKRGFGAPVDAWFQGSLGAEMRGLLDQSGMADTYFNKAELKNRTGRPMTSRQGFQLWIIFNVMKWHEKMSSELSKRVKHVV
jgi:asparagine synthase (glutamine-hydrolysing)